METYVIHVSKECNCDCLYCYEKDKTSKYTRTEVLEYAQAIIDTASGDFTVEFLGGEPMLEWGHIVAVYELFENSANPAQGYTITTNGTIVSEYIGMYLVNNRKLNMSISIDGNKFANQLRVFKNGENTYEKVIANCKFLMDFYNVIPTIHFTTHKFNVSHIYDSIVLLHSKGLKHIAVGTVESTMPIDKEYCDIYIAQLKKVSDLIKTTNKYKDLYISQFEWLKPKSDIRKYLTDASGKTIGETYGRVENDITSKDSYNVKACNETTSVSEMIYNIRETVYLYHNSK